MEISKVAWHQSVNTFQPNFVLFLVFSDTWLTILVEIKKSNDKARTLTIKLANNSDISLAFCLSWPLLFSPRWLPTLICWSDAKRSPVAMWRHTGTRIGSINVTGKHVSPAWDAVSNAADKSNISSTTTLLPSIACRILQKHEYWKKNWLRRRG